MQAYDLLEESQTESLDTSKSASSEWDDCVLYEQEWYLPAAMISERLIALKQVVAPVTEIPRLPWLLCHYL